MAVKQVQFPTGYEKLDDFWNKVVLVKIPGAKMYDKSTSKIMWVLYAISLMWIWNRKFFDTQTTTLGRGVYIPHIRVGQKLWNRVYKTMRHELMHFMDDKKWKILFKLSYLFPQVLVLFAFGAFFTPWFLFALIFLGPWPAPWRVHWEMRGYTQSMVVAFEEGDNLDKGWIDWLEQTFCGWMYWRMSWSKKKLRKWANETILKIRKKEIAGPYLS